MIFASPFLYGYDREPHYYQPAYHHQRSTPYYGGRRSEDERDQGEYELLEQFRAAQQAQRRAKAQKYQRMQVARKEYIDRVKEEEAYRQAYEAAKRRRQMEEAKQMQQYLYGNEYDDNVSNEDKEVTEPIFRMTKGPKGQFYKVKVGKKAQTAKAQQTNSPATTQSHQELEATKPIFRLIQGSDGNLYKVKVGEETRRPRPKPQRRSSPLRQSRRPSSPQQSTEEDTFQLIRGPDGRIYRINLNQLPKKEEDQPTRRTKSMSNRAGIDYGRRGDFSLSPSTWSSSSLVDEETDIAPRRIPIRKSSKDQKRKQKGILVEDASDSESENDDLKSIWRNRRPSPGQWMEPIQSF
jgi:hypothetical protein